MNIQAWNFAVFKEFYQKLYRECLTHEQLEKNGVPEFYESVFKIQDGFLKEYIYDDIDFRTVVMFDKNNTKYVLPAIHLDQLPIKITSTEAIQLKKSDRRIWHMITGFTQMNISAKKVRSFTEFIDNWNPMESRCPDDWTLIKLIAFASLWKGVKLCICSNPNAGKTANFSLLRYISDDIGRITDPTLAKWESMMYHNKVLLPDEVSSWKPATIREIESPIIVIGDGSVEYNKHSKASNKLMERMDAAGLSLIFTYNRPQDLKKGEQFFDDCWNNPGAFKSRYPQLLVDNDILTKMQNLASNEAKPIMEEHFAEIASIAKECMYFRYHINDEMHNYDRTLLNGLSNRHTVNMQGLFDVVDAYSETQDIFDTWCLKILNCMTAYKSLTSETVDQSKQSSLMQPNDTTPLTVTVERVATGKGFDLKSSKLSEFDTIDEDIL